MTDNINTHYSLNRAMSQKFGYDSIDEYKEKVQAKFSLLENGILEQNSTKLLLMNVGHPLSSHGIRLTGCRA